MREYDRGELSQLRFENRFAKEESGGVGRVINKAKHHPVVCMWSPGSGQPALKVKTLGCFSQLLSLIPGLSH